MQQKADVFEQVEGPRSCGALVHLLLVFGLMRVDAFKDAQSPENQREIRNYLSVTWRRLGGWCQLASNFMCLGVGLVVLKRLIDDRKIVNR